MRIPDCTARPEEQLLSADDRRELVRRIAEDGVGAIEAFIREREGADRTLRARVSRLRDDLVRKAEELKRALEGSFRARRDAVETEWQDAYRRMEEERAATERELGLVRLSREQAVAAAVASDELVKLVTAPPPPVPWWRRAWNAIVAFLALVGRVLLWPLRALARLLGFSKPAAKRVKGRVVAGLPGGVTLDARAFRSNAALRRAVRERAKTLSTRERARSLWERMLGREDYEEFAMRLMERELAERAKEAQSRFKPQEETFASKLAEVMEAERRRAAERENRLEELERERARELERLRETLKETPEHALSRELASELEDAGFLSKKGEAFMPTTRLLERFAAIAYGEEAKRIPTGQSRATGAVLDGTGELRKEPMRSAYETAHMDTGSTLVRARTRHPHVRHIYEDDVLVHREDREAVNHVVIVFDRSGSMEENDRLKAAKRAVMALWRAVKDDNPLHQVDIIAMDTSVEKVDLVGVWRSEPRGFTNTGAALRMAYDLLRFSKGERALVYLVTDGLPEAYTKNGVDVASQPEKCLAYALEQARLLANRPSLGVVQILLEPDDELYVSAAERIAKEVRGRVVKTSPKDLARTMLSEFERGRGAKAAGGIR